MTTKIQNPGGCIHPMEGSIEVTQVSPKCALGCELNFNGRWVCWHCTAPEMQAKLLEARVLNRQVAYFCENCQTTTEVFGPEAGDGYLNVRRIRYTRRLEVANALEQARWIVQYLQAAADNKAT